MSCDAQTHVDTHHPFHDYPHVPPVAFIAFPSTFAYFSFTQDTIFI